MSYTHSPEEGEVSSPKSVDERPLMMASNSKSSDGFTAVANPAVRQMQVAARGMNPTAPPHRPLPPSFANHFPIVPAAAAATVMRNPSPPKSPAAVASGPGSFPITSSAHYGPSPFSQAIQTVGLHGNPVNRVAGPCGTPINFNRKSGLFAPYAHSVAYAPPINQSRTSEYGVGMGGSYGPRAPPKGATPTAHLSYECQRRHFNPVFKIDEQAKGRYGCDIVVRGVVVEGGSTFVSPHEAKNHAATKAFKIVQKWSIVDPLAGPSATGFNPRAGEDDPQGEVGGPSAEVNIGDPTQARAFAEGFKMGLLAASGDGRGSISGQRAHTRSRRDRSRSRSRSRSRTPRRERRRRRRSRSRSPARYSKTKRERSPSRYFGGGRRDPSLPSTDRYRPNELDTLNKRNGDEEDSFGRLKREDFCEED